MKHFIDSIASSEGATVIVVVAVIVIVLVAVFYPRPMTADCGRYTEQRSTQQCIDLRFDACMEGEKFTREECIALIKDSGK